MLEEQLKALFEEYGLTDEHAVTFGHPKMKMKWVLPLPGVSVYSFEQFQPFFIYFDSEGISFFPLNEKNYAMGRSFIGWGDIKEFQFKKGLVMEDGIKVQGADFKIEMKIPKAKAMNPWVKENNAYLSENNYFYGQA